MNDQTMRDPVRPTSSTTTGHAAATVALIALLSGCSLAGSTGDVTTEDSGADVSVEVAGDEAAAVAGDEDSATTTLATTTTSLRPPEPRPLVIEVQPSDAVVDLRTADGWTHQAEGSQAIEVDVPAEVVEVTVSADGYQTYNGEIVFAEEGGPTEVTIWLDRPNQLVSKLLEVEVGGAPKGVAFTPDGSEVWATLLNGGGVDVVDVATAEVAATIDLGPGAVEVMFNQSGDSAYVSQMETNSVFEIDVASRSVKRQLNTKGAWTKVMALSPDEKMLYASNWVDGNVSEIDLASGEVTRLLRTVRTPRGLYPTVDGKRLYVTGFESGELQVFDLATGEGEIILRTGGSLRHLVGSLDGSVLYASDLTKDTVFAVDTTTNDITELATTDHKPNTIDLSPDGRILFVSNRGRNNSESYYLPGPEWGTVLLIDTETGAMLDAIVGGNQTTGLDVSDDVTMVTFSDLLDNRVVVYQVPSTETLLAGDGGSYQNHLIELAK